MNKNKNNFKMFLIYVFDFFLNVSLIEKEHLLKSEARQGLGILGRRAEQRHRGRDVAAVHEQRLTSQSLHICIER